MSAGENKWCPICGLDERLIKIVDIFEDWVYTVIKSNILDLKGGRQNGSLRSTGSGI